MTHDTCFAIPPALSGIMSFPGDDTYENATRIFSISSCGKPKLVAHCRTPEDVQAAVKYARESGLPLSVRGGGHDWAGRALCNGLVIDLSLMRNVEVSPDRRSAWIGGGCRVADVSAVLDPLGLAAVAGSVGAVGMAGLTLGGGYGPLIGRFGLCLDNLLGAEIVLADGRCVLTDPQHESDLFWALRGGGGNFGVVTLLHIALHELPSVHGGIILFPLSDAAPVLADANALLRDAPDELTAQIGLIPGPAGDTVAMVAPLWCGDPHEGERRLAPFTALGTPLSTNLQTTTFGASSKIWDAYCVTGAHAVMANRWLPRLMPDTFDIWIDAIRRARGVSGAVFTHEFRGAAARVPPDATAFGFRDDHVLVEILGMSPDADGVEAATEWVEALSKDLAPMSLPGGYANLLAPRHTDQIDASFGVNAARLRRIKTRYDPANVFRSTLPLPAASPALPRPARPGAARRPGREDPTPPVFVWLVIIAFYVICGTIMLTTSAATPADTISVTSP